MIKKCFNFLLKKVKCLNNIQISDNKFIFIYSLYFTTILNFGLWRYVYNSIIIDSFIIFIFLISLPIVLCSVLYAFFNIILFPKTYKILSILFLLITSITNYFVFELNVFINEGMIINVIGTTVAESVDLITSRLIFYLFFTGIIPSFLVYKIKINTSPIKKNLLNRIIRIGMSFGILLLIICIVVKQYFFYG
ncbi:MAG: DUF1705 domain-containing protein, partial [Rickettsiales bacterium]|nr:DUF1705 domain-containing protein [Rickettsiales bacterium]